MPNKALQQYFKESQFDNEYEQYLLMDVLGKDKVFRILYDNTSNKNKKKRDTILHLYLWDLNYYIKGSDSEIKGSDSECFQMHKIWWSDNKKKDLMNCLNEKNEALSKLIFDIIKHWELLRDEIFCEDYDELKKCDTLEKYKKFIEEHPNTYPEYILIAKYEIAELTGSPFIELQEVIREYPNSEWVKDLSKRCKKTSVGIPYTFSRCLNNHSQSQIIIEEFFESFIEISQSDKDAGGGGVVYITGSFVSEKLWNAVMGRRGVFRRNVDIERMMSFFETKAFMDMLGRLTWTKFRLPTKQEWLDYNNQLNCTVGVNNSNDSYHNHPDCHTWLWCIPSLDAKEGSFVTTTGCAEIYPVPGGSYAACQFVLDN